MKHLNSDWSLDKCATHSCHSCVDYSINLLSIQAVTLSTASFPNIVLLWAHWDGHSVDDAYNTIVLAGQTHVQKPLFQPWGPQEKSGFLIWQVSEKLWAVQEKICQGPSRVSRSRLLELSLSHNIDVDYDLLILFVCAMSAMSTSPRKLSFIWDDIWIGCILYMLQPRWARSLKFC